MVESGGIKLRKVIINIIRKFFIIKSWFRNDLVVDIQSDIGLKTYSGINGTNKYKTIIKNSTLTGNIKVGKGCKLMDVNCSGNITMGRFVSLNGPGTRISSRIYGIEIGSFSSIASNVVIQEDYHRQNKVSTYFMNKNIFNGDISEDIYSKGKVIIEEDVWIGSNSVILSGVRIGRGSIIGAGSIVTKNIPRYSIVVGNPAKIIKKRFSDEIIKKLEDSKWWEMTEKEIIDNKQKFTVDLTEE